ncbi:hypothetical protein FIU86_19855 [Roseovarius sp. THAF9]|uniref:helix-turn-helix transcriptional regulator n=1 Tax=Roseovarius sp. THAF9 TaxID=2587847 RepID=UPI0012679350|nr:AlpA family phage regulatory protein [Roseovarius sp. THAF9]QFT95115.1 hypothetical protein FIU86_19855 [Roseovarius sp. THAF9]
MKYLTIQGLQAKLGNRSRSSLYRDIEAGRLPKPIKFSARVYWAKADIDAAIAAHAK